MNIKLLFVTILATCSTFGCKEKNTDMIENNSPLNIVKIQDYSELGQSQSIPLEIIDIVKSLEFRKSDIIEKELGVSPHKKIKYFDITAYVEYIDGWVIASDRGEWGGVIFWINKQGGYKIIRDDDLAYTIDLITEGNMLLASQGMSHLGLDEGHLLTIQRIGNNFKTRMYPLNGYPSDFEKREKKWTLSVPLGYYDIAELQDGKQAFYKVE